MKNFLLLTIMSCAILFSCQQQKREVDKVALVKDYIKALNRSDYKAIIDSFHDSVRMKELDYISAMSKSNYYQFFQWDSTFVPEYKIISIKELDGAVNMQVSKNCSRIDFLHEEPTVNDELVTFENGQIKHIEIVKYIVFNDEKWSKNRARLTNWIKEHHPELDGFLYDQTKAGALNYLQAIKLFREREE